MRPPGEADKNMLSGERSAASAYPNAFWQVRIFPVSLDFDFEPDTFGHSVNVPGS